MLRVSSKRGLASKQRRETEMPYQYVETRCFASLASEDSRRNREAKRRRETERRNRDAKQRREASRLYNGNMRYNPCSGLMEEK